MPLIKRRRMRRRRRAREEKRQATDFKEDACCPSAVIQGAERRKNGLYEGSARGNWDPREGQQPFRPDPNWVGDCTIMLRRLLIGAEKYGTLYRSQSSSFIITANKKHLTGVIRHKRFSLIPFVVG